MYQEALEDGIRISERPKRTTIYYPRCHQCGSEMAVMAYRHGVKYTCDACKAREFLKTKIREQAREERKKEIKEEQAKRAPIQRKYTYEYLDFWYAQDFGLYFIYDKNDELIYIGKSETNIESRAKDSIINKGAQKVQFYYPKSKADTRVYELYYINKHKPKFNRDAKTDDALNVDLPEIEHSEILTVFWQTKYNNSAL